MSKRKLIISELEQVPESLLEEILDFIRFLGTKAAREKLETAIASEPSLQKDWLRPEEDEAWQDL
jgi:hypothetical protein